MAQGTHTLAKRLSFSAIIIACIYYVIFYAPFPLYIVCTSLAIGMALYELFTMTEKAGFTPNKWLGIGCGMCYPLLTYFPVEALVVAGSILLFSFLNFKNVDTEGSSSGFVNTAITVLGLCYVALLMSFFVKVRLMTDGTKWIAYAIWVTKMGDAGAYFVGTHFGKIKPFGRISPNKSLEGAIGGLIWSVVVSLLFKTYLPETPLLHFLILGLCIGILTQLGDLTESLIKRELHAKDSGVIPGLGGMLDIVDSLLFTVPFVFYYLVANQ